MRRGNIDNPNSYKDLLADPLFSSAFTWLKTNPRPDPSPVRYNINDDVHAMSIEYTPAHPSEGKLETHQEYVDLQLHIGRDGGGFIAERIMVANATDLAVDEAASKPKDDLTFYKTPDSELSSELLKPGDFIIFDTETDAHMPQCIHNYKAKGNEDVMPTRKIVVKIRKSKLQSETAAKLQELV